MSLHFNDYACANECLAELTFQSCNRVCRQPTWQTQTIKYVVHIPQVALKRPISYSYCQCGLRIIIGSNCINFTHISAASHDEACSLLIPHCSSDCISQRCFSIFQWCSYSSMCKFNPATSWSDPNDLRGQLSILCKSGGSYDIKHVQMWHSAYM